MAFAWNRLSFNWSSINSARCHWAALLRKVTASIIRRQVFPGMPNQQNLEEKHLLIIGKSTHKCSLICSMTCLWYTYMILHVPSKTWAIHAAAYSTNLVHHKISSRFLTCADRWVVRDQINLNIRDHVENTLPTGALPLLRQGWKEVPCW